MFQNNLDDSLNVVNYLKFLHVVSIVKKSIKNWFWYLCKLYKVTTIISHN